MIFSNHLFYYILKIIYPNCPLYAFPLFLKLCAFYKLYYNRNKHVKLKLQIIPIELYNDLTELSKNDHIIYDNDSTLIVSKFVYKFLTNTNRHNWVKLFTERKTSSKHGVRVLPIRPSNVCLLNTILLTENTYFNLRKYFNEKRDIHNILLKSFNDKLPSIADDLLISFIKSPIEVPTDLLHAALGTYFSSPKLIFTDDIYEIPLNEETTGSVYFKYMNICDTLKFIYFKCIKVSGNRNPDVGYFAVKELTAIQEQQNISSLLPSKSYLYNSRKQNLNQLVNYFVKFKKYNIAYNCPNGLKQYHEMLIESLSSFVDNSCLVNIHPVFLMQGPAGVGKNIIIESVASTLGIRMYTVDCSELMCPTTAQSESKVKYTFERAKIAAPVLLCFQRFEVFGIDHENEIDMRLINTFQTELNLLLTNNSYPIVVIALYNNKVIPATLQRLFLEKFTIKPPSENERQEILKWIFQVNNVVVDTDTVINLSSKSAGFLFEDLKLMVKKSMKNIDEKSMMLDENDFDPVLREMLNSYRDSIGAPKVPKVNWSDIGGLADLKEEIIKSIKNPTGGIDLFSSGNSKRSGLLLYGPPGTGKTLLAKAIATESKYNFLSVKGPELLNMYVGQSEQNVRNVFERARAATPCVIFFDELDSLAPNRGAKGDSGGVMDSIVAQLLAEMDCIENESESHTLFIVGATNRPDLLDPALLRPGRLDKLLYVGLCETISSKATVLKTILRKFNLDNNVDIEQLAQLLYYDMSGADLHSICSKAWMSAVKRLLQVNNQNTEIEHHYTSESITVSMDDFKTAINQFVPSVSPKDMAYFKQMQQQNQNAHDNKKNVAENILDNRAIS